MTQCIFCRIVAGEIPASIVYEDEETVAFMDIGAVNPGHVLVASKRHADDVFELDDAAAGAVLKTAAKVARAVKQVFAPDGLNLFQANGEVAGQTVFHFHMHVLPRRRGDGMELTWPVKNPPRGELEENAARLRHTLGGS